MVKKVMIVSLVVLFFAIGITSVVWFSVSLMQRVNPELNIGRKGYIPTVFEPVTSECSGDKVCMQGSNTEEIRTVPSTCNDDTKDVGALEALGWTRCSVLY